jgi:hypothetical protein
MPKPSMAAASAGRSQAFRQASAPARPIPARPFRFSRRPVFRNTGPPSGCSGQPAKCCRRYATCRYPVREPPRSSVIGVGADTAPRSTRDIWAWRSSAGIPVPRDVRAGDHVAGRDLAMPTGTAVLRKAGTRDAESPLRQTCTRQANVRTPDQIRLRLGNRQQEVLSFRSSLPCRSSITSCESKIGAP